MLIENLGPVGNGPVDPLWSLRRRYEWPIIEQGQRP